MTEYEEIIKKLEDVLKEIERLGLKVTIEDINGGKTYFSTCRGGRYITSIPSDIGSEGVTEKGKVMLKLFESIAQNLP